MFVAILGYGVVGSGVVEILENNSKKIEYRTGRKISVKKILDIRDFSSDPNAHLFTQNAEDIFEDDEISVVIETIGGAGVAYEFTKKALIKGKSVVTSNKELVATHGPELLELAASNNATYLFEASVGGGIPIIRPLYNCLAANDIHHIIGILNGTTNYILTAMKKAGKSFETALKEAQQKGYAEANPTADVEGHDAGRKIAILSSIAFNEFVDFKDVSTQGISMITVDDMHNAESLGYSIKLVGESIKNEDGVIARVSPVLLQNSHPLANVDDVFNAIMVDGDAVGTAMFYGKGAGKLPTASAVVADIMDIAKKCRCSEHKIFWDRNKKSPSLSSYKLFSRFFLSLTSNLNKVDFIEIINTILPDSTICNGSDECGFVLVTGKENEGEFDKKLSLIKSKGFEVQSCIRVVDEV